MSDPPSGTEWVIDKSALARLGASADAGGWAERIQRGAVHIATVTLLEVGYSARDAADIDSGLRGPPVSSMPIEYLTPIAEDLAVDVLPLLAGRGHHRAPSVPDLIIAAIPRPQAWLFSTTTRTSTSSPTSPGTGRAPHRMSSVASPWSANRSSSPPSALGVAHGGPTLPPGEGSSSARIRS